MSSDSDSLASTVTDGLIRGHSLSASAFFTQMEGKWKKPSEETAIALAQKEVYQEGNARLCNSTKDFSSLGFSIPLYFRFLKITGASLGVFFLFNIPTLLLALSGSNLDSDSVIGLSSTTFGNIGHGKDYTCDADADVLQMAAIGAANQTVQSGCASSDQPIKLLGSDIALDTACYLMTACDFLGCIFLVSMYLYFRTLLYELKSKVDREHITASDYAVMVRRLPPSATKGQILHHFNTLYDPNKAQSYSFKGWCNCFCRRKLKANMGSVNVQDWFPAVSNRDLNTKESADPNHPFYAKYEGSYVAEVAVAYEGNGDLIRHYLKCDGLYLKLLRCRAKVQKYKSLEVTAIRLGDKEMLKEHKEKHKQAEEELDKLQLHLQKMRAKLNKKRYDQSVSAQAGTNKQVVHKVAAKREAAGIAFVIFNHRESFLRCVEDYKMSRTSCYRCCLPTPLKFMDEFNIEVHRAPEPGSIIWEHLDTKPRDKCARRCCSAWSTILLLLISSAVFSVGTGFRKSWMPDMQCVNEKFCTHELSSSYYNRYLPTGSVPPIVRDLSKDKHCEGKKVYLTMRADNETVYNSTACDSPCRDAYQVPNAFDDVSNQLPAERCKTAACNLPAAYVPPTAKCTYFDKSCIVVCYCKQKLSELSRKEGGLSAAIQIMSDDPQYNSLCGVVLQALGLGQVLTVLAVLLVVAFNWVLQRVLHVLAEFEHHNSTGSENKSKLSKVFTARFINTALVMLVVASDGFLGGLGSVYRYDPNEGRTNFNYAVYSLFDFLQVFNGSHKDTSEEWYAAVATGLLIAMIIEIVMPVLGTVTRYAYLSCRKWLCRKNRLVQHDLDELYKRPTLQLEKRYAHMLTVNFVTLFYSAGLPLMPLLGFLCFLLVFWFDKVMLVRVYSTSRNDVSGLDGSLALMASRILPWAVVIHLGMAMWLFGNDNIAYSTSFPPSSGTILSFTGGNTTIYRAWMSFITTAGQVDPFEWEYCEQASLMYNSSAGDSIVSCSQKDGVVPGIVRRLVRGNVFPLFLLFVVLIVLLVLRLIGAPLYKLMNEMVFCVKQKRVKVAPSKDRSVYCEYTSDFVLEVREDQVEYAQLKFSTSRKGWKVTDVEDRPGYKRLQKVWRQAGVDESGLAHKKGDVKKTWQVIAETGGWSYNMFKNEKYRIAMMSSVGQYLQHTRAARTKDIHGDRGGKIEISVLEKKQSLRHVNSHWDLKHRWDDMHYRAVVRQVRGSWQQMVDVQDKSTYYYNTLTEESQWDPPDEFIDEFEDPDQTHKVHLRRNPSRRAFSNTFSGRSLNSTGRSSIDRVQSLVDSLNSSKSTFVSDLAGIDEVNNENEFEELPEAEEEVQFSSSFAPSDWTAQHQESVPVAVHGMWQKFYDPTYGRHYYYHKMLGMSQWEEPHEWWSEGDVHAEYNDWTPVVDDEHNLLFYYNTKTKAAQSEAPHFSIDVEQCARRHLLVNESNQHNQSMWDSLCDNAELLNTTDGWEEWRRKDTQRSFFRHTQDNWYQWENPHEYYLEGDGYEEHPEVNSDATTETASSDDPYGYASQDTQDTHDTDLDETHAI